MRCIVCNWENSSNEIYCKSCGTRLRDGGDATAYNNTENQTRMNDYGEYYDDGRTLYGGGEEMRTVQDSNSGYYSDTSYRDTSYRDYDRTEMHRYDDRDYRSGSERKTHGKGLTIAFIAIIVVLLSGIIGLGAYIILDDPPKTDPVVSSDGQDKNDESDKSDELKGTQGSDNPVKHKKDEPKSTINDYEVIKAPVTWLQAKQKAEDSGGCLVSINSYEEYVHVCNLALENGVTTFWAGATRGSGSWSDAEWLDGTNMNDTPLFWHDGEPSYVDKNTKETELYLMVYVYEDNWGYNDTANDISKYHRNKMGYIIEYEY